MAGSVRIQRSLDVTVGLRLRCRFQQGNPRIHVLNDSLYERDRQRIVKPKQGSFQFGATPADSDYLVFNVHGDPRLMRKLYRLASPDGNSQISAKGDEAR
jgi:hypothetical protein